MSDFFHEHFAKDPRKIVYAEQALSLADHGLGACVFNVLVALLNFLSFTIGYEDKGLATFQPHRNFPVCFVLLQVRF